MFNVPFSPFLKISFYSLRMRVRFSNERVMSVEHGLVRWKGRVAVVTGASAGIGYETVKHLALSGMTVVGCARNTAKIEVH